MKFQETPHSQKVRRILNSKFGFVPALDWNLTQWLPASEKRVQFVIHTQTFHGVVCVDVDPKSENVFIIGYADFNINSVAKSILVHQAELIDFIDNLNQGFQPHSPNDNCSEVPHDARMQDSFNP